MNLHRHTHDAHGEEVGTNPDFRFGDSSKSSPDDSHTAAEFIDTQLQLEADAREALPYKFDHCTKPLGKIRQTVFSCLTCNPVRADPSKTYQPAGICYSCSIQCHGDHTLVELFYKRNFQCECGTARFPETLLCKLRPNPEMETKRESSAEQVSSPNKYNQNFYNRFCGCECDYDAENQTGTMFQCLGLGSVETGGCGEDWWHASCIVGLEPDWYEKQNYNSASPDSKNLKKRATASNISKEIDAGKNSADSATTQVESGGIQYDDMDFPYPPGFPAENEFEGFICYKCVDSYPWIKRYAGSPGFLQAVFLRDKSHNSETYETHVINNQKSDLHSSKKRRASGVDDLELDSRTVSRLMKKGTNDNQSYTKTAEFSDAIPSPTSMESQNECKFKYLPPVQTGKFSIFFKEDFRSHLCHCDDCFPKLQIHPHLLEPEETYEPSVSTDPREELNSTAGSGSLYERGESMLKNIDRVKAIEGVMAYNHLKDKLKPFFQQFAESGKAISAEDIKAHFAKIRGDELGIKPGDTT
ncbi:metaphase-anaphase transition protein Mlo2 [Golovinomyces cichoracearum]|uniref:Metaphase-anaphase transition protein Mlo2 n=1 Tax=Golovinomyces cichoracearum TaxID=62708 RepID=A0A420HMJ0_9PEZI|nr:metaphase-anaphase transition protein Mlo2 [Golovinomyces cichoracearum]